MYKNPAAGHDQMIGYIGQAEAPARNAHAWSVFFVLLYYLLANMQGFYFNIGVKVMPIDILIVCALMGYVFYYAMRPDAFTIMYGIFVLPAVFYYLYIMWGLVGVVLSEYPNYAITYFIQVLRGLVVISIFMVIPFSKRDMEFLNDGIFAIGVVIAIISVALYYNYYLDIAFLKRNAAYWKGFGYNLDRTGYLRMNGMSGDSNFFSIYLCLALFCGFNSRKRPRYVFPGIVVLAIAVLISFSRTIIAAVTLSVLAMYLIRYYRFTLKSMKFAFIGLLVATIVILIIIQVFDFNPLDVLRLRFSQINNEESRFMMWRSLVSNLDSSAMYYGYGFRSSQSNLAGHYAHNTYLETVYDSGIIGLLFFAMILFSTMMVVFRIKEDGRLVKIAWPWVQMFIVNIIFSFFFTYGTNPYFWLIVGMILAMYKIKDEVDADGDHIQKDGGI